MRKDQIFPSKYLKEADLRGREHVVTIKGVERVSFQGKPGLVLYFEGKDKGLAVNQTIFDQVSIATGEDDTENWAGCQITLYPTETTYQNEMRPVVRVRTKPPDSNGQKKRRDTPPPDVDTEEEDDMADVPF